MNLRGFGRWLLRAGLTAIAVGGALGNGGFILSAAAAGAESSPAYMRANGGFGGYFESSTLSRLQLAPEGEVVRGLIDRDGTIDWRIEARPVFDGAGLKGEATGGGRRVPWTASWRDDALVVKWADRELVYHRTVPLSPVLTKLGSVRVNPKNRWTLAVYLGGDNNLEAAALADLQEMRAALPAEGVEVIALIDRAKGFEIDERGDWTDSRILRIRPNGAPDEILARPGELDTGDAETLASFLTSAFLTFPAEHYAAVIWNHGGGWTGVVTDEDVPTHPGKTNMLNLIDIRVALRTAILHGTRRPLDLLGFDACNMAQLEVALQVNDLARFMTASEAIVPGLGYPYDRILPMLGDRSKNPRAVAIGIADAFAGSYRDFRDETTTVSAIDLGAVPDVARALSDFAFLGEVFKESYWPAVQRALFYAESYGARSERLLPGSLPSIDVRDLVHRIAEGMKPIPLDQWVNTLDAALDRAVLASRNGDLRHRSGGLAIFGPRIASQAVPGYAITPLARANDWTKLLASAREQAAKHTMDPIEFSDVTLVASMIEGRQVVRPFDADSINFTLKGTSIVELLQIDQQRDGPGWAVLRKRWVPDPLWMGRVKQGATEVTDLFMPRFVDGENRLQIELTGQRFLVTDGTNTVNLTLDATAPDHGAAMIARANYYPRGSTVAEPVEFSFDPVWWIATELKRLKGDPNIAQRPLAPKDGDEFTFIIETVDDQGNEATIETARLTWRGRGPALLFAQDDPGEYRSTFVARTLDGREFYVAVDYPVEANPAMTEWIESWKDIDWTKLHGNWNRHVLLPEGGTLDTKTRTTIAAASGPAGVFEVTSEVVINGRTESLPQYWVFQPGPVPSLRIISPVAGSPDLCWFGPARLGQEDKTPWLALKALQVGGVTWRWDLSLYDQLRLK